MTFKPKSKKTNFKNVLSNAMRMVPRNSVVFLISDFMAEGKETFEEFERDLKIFRKAQDLVALSVRDPREFKLPNIGYIEAINPETGHKELLNLNKKSTRAHFNRVQDRYFNDLRDKFKRLGVDVVDIKTHKSYVPQLLTLFMGRERRN